MSYKIKKLVDEGFDFGTLYPDKQEEARSATLLNFSISEIVEFLRKQTNDFRDDFPLAQDLDEAIYRLYEKQKAKQKEAEPEPEPKPEIEIPKEAEPKAMPSGEKAPPSKESLEKQIKALKYLAEKKNNESAKKQLKVFNFLMKKYYNQ
jgi:hypothetical protein